MTRVIRIPVMSRASFTRPLGSGLVIFVERLIRRIGWIEEVCGISRIVVTVFCGCCFLCKCLEKLRRTRVWIKRIQPENVELYTIDFHEPQPASYNIQKKENTYFDPLFLI